MLFRILKFKQLSEKQGSTNYNPGSFQHSTEAYQFDGNESCSHKMSQQSFVALHVLVVFCLVKERVASELCSQVPVHPTNTAVPCGRGTTKAHSLNTERFIRL